MKKFIRSKVFDNKKAILSVVLFLTFLIIAGCSKGGSKSGNLFSLLLSSVKGAGAPSISGVAAAGSPIIGNVFLKDSANRVIGPIQTGADGSFLFDVTGLTQPFYLFVDGQVGSTHYLLYSVTTSPNGIANINPLTNTIVAAAAGSIDPASVYNDPTAHPVTQSKIDKAITDLQTMLGSILVTYNAENINPISDSFTADHTKLDKIFDIIAITVDSTGGDVTVTVTDNFTGHEIAKASTGHLEDPTTPLAPENFPLVGTITKGADRLIAAQNSDGGWEWPNPGNDPTVSDTVDASAVNTIGVTALGILDAYKITKNSDYCTACIKVYNLLLSNSINTVPWHTYPRNKIRGADITFLVELSEVTGDPTYANFAKTWYQATLTGFFGGTAEILAKTIRDVRKSQSLPALISWDINLYIQGVLALDRYFAEQGFDADAASMTEVIYNSLYDKTALFFDTSNTAQTDVWLGYTGAIEAFTTTGLHLDNRNLLTSALITSQQSAGNFAGIKDPADVQTTAYAVMALLKAGKNDAAKNGVKYLVNRQIDNGKWLEPDGIEYTESSSEAIHAIYNFQK